MKLRKENKIGRNEKCHCGSGKKYKKCCLITQHNELLKQREIRRIAEDAYKQKRNEEQN